MKKKHVALITALMSSIAMTVQAQAIRDTITIAAGYAPYPMAVAMAEQFTQADKPEKPRIFNQPARSWHISNFVLVMALILWTRPSFCAL